MELAIKYSPLSNKLCCWRYLPTLRESILAPAILFWGFRCEPLTVHAVRCACGGFASGLNFRGEGRGVSMPDLQNVLFFPDAEFIQYGCEIASTKADADVPVVASKQAGWRYCDPGFPQQLFAEAGRRVGR